MMSTPVFWDIIYGHTPNHILKTREPHSNKNRHIHRTRTSKWATLLPLSKEWLWLSKALLSICMDGKEGISYSTGGQPRNKSMRSLVSILFISMLHNSPPCIPSKSSPAGKEELVMSYVDWDLSRANIIDGCFPPRNLDWIQKHSITSLETDQGHCTIMWSLSQQKANYSMGLFLPNGLIRLNKSQCIQTIRFSLIRNPVVREPLITLSHCVDSWGFRFHKSTSPHHWT